MTGISISSGLDQLVVIHLNDGNDFLFSLVNLKDNQNSNINRVGELVAVLLHQYYLLQKRELKVKVGEPVFCKLGKKDKKVDIEFNAPSVISITMN
ncbi:unnamed protein product [Oppiella nova]|uniref:TH1 domain-containing protein n=1 Tax=Oppiella nova TaxID=334625 RepID=A0A7R9QZP6_9ACAR|nr:unnamed protein product [Oppiella nova]CAG2180423.1 unnamed protein product [Oppiella nova]